MRSPSVTFTTKCTSIQLLKYRSVGSADGVLWNTPGSKRCQAGQSNITSTCYQHNSSANHIHRQDLLFAATNNGFYLKIVTCWRSEGVSE